MKTNIFILVLSLVVVYNCNAQSNNNSKNQPKTDYKVNKEYDENGNLIRYDSTYTYSYSSNGNDAMNDSVFNEFQKHFNQRFSFSNDPFFNNFLFQDSLMDKEFFSNDFFENHYRNNMEMFSKLFNDMDMMKNDYFNNQPQQTPENSEKKEEKIEEVKPKTEEYKPKETFDF